MKKQSKQSKQDTESFSSPKRKLLEAKQQDAQYEKEVAYIIDSFISIISHSFKFNFSYKTKTAETCRITRNMSELFVSNAMQSVIGRVSTPATKSRK